MHEGLRAQCPGAADHWSAGRSRSSSVVFRPEARSTSTARSASGGLAVLGDHERVGVVEERVGDRGAGAGRDGQRASARAAGPRRRRRAPSASSRRRRVTRSLVEPGTGLPVERDRWTGAAADRLGGAAERAPAGTRLEASTGLGVRPGAAGLTEPADTSSAGDDDVPEPQEARTSSGRGRGDHSAYGASHAEIVLEVRLVGPVATCSASRHCTRSMNGSSGSKRCWFHGSK